MAKDSRIIRTIHTEKTVRTARTLRLDVRTIREKFGLTQEDFSHTFGFSKRTLQNWEGGHRRPSRAACILLLVIEKNPQVVKKVLSNSMEVRFP